MMYIKDKNEKSLVKSYEQLKYKQLQSDLEMQIEEKRERKRREEEVRRREEREEDSRLRL